MKRKDFYNQYYERTNESFSDKITWGKKERLDAWRKRQLPFSKFERKIYIIIQYFILFLCWIPVCFDGNLWIVIPIAFIISLLSSLITDFSFIKIEMLYHIYSKDNSYSSILYDIFIGNFTYFISDLKGLTSKKVTGYVFKIGGKFYCKYFAVCRNKDSIILLTFKRNKILVTVDKNVTVINAELSKNQLLEEISAIIN